ncbi:MAG: DUF512 domain-containing protein [Butyricicoccus pullicaecorum]|nr:DUF512 domain-containing protein [Butyricicoccus pullicaecorum]
MASKIISVDPDSPADRAGIVSGETLLTIDGTAVRDVLDYKFYGYDAQLSLALLSQTGEQRTVEIRKREGEPLGLNFEHYLMDKMKRCSNKCVFCFIDQMPKGMRETLYVKDDDARMSFLLGNYITMTNLSEEDVQRILRMHISPINISVQTTNPELRVKMLQNPKAGKALALLPRFAEGGIRMNCQLVICEGMNDGDELRRSLSDLEALYPAVSSISVVPFGMTIHREGLYPLQPTTKEGAEEMLDIVEAFAEKCLEKHGTRLAWCGDEVYLKAGRPLPDASYYEDFTQFENGIGMLPLFSEEFRLALPDYKGQTPRPFCIATGKAASGMMDMLIDEARKVCNNLNGNIYAIENMFFGSGVTVAGLITGQDLLRQLQGKALGERVLISANMLRDGGDVFLDDLTLSEVAEKLGVPVVPVEIDGADLLSKIFEES